MPDFEAQLQKSFSSTEDFTGGLGCSPKRSATIINTALLKAALPRTVVDHNRQSSSNNFKYNAMSDTESSQFSSDMENDGKKILDDSQNTAHVRDLKHPL